jgi:hypothetical protein
MKTVSVNLICKECGNAFTHTKSVRGNGDTYKFWAMNNIDQCPKCYAEQKRRERVRWTLQFLSDNGIELKTLVGTPNQIRYAERLREDFLDKYYYEVVDVVEKYNAERNSLRIEAQEKGVEMGQAALQRWEGTKAYYLFASVYIKSAGFLIDMFLGKGIEKVA